MNSSKLPVLFGLVGVVVAVALFLVLKDDTADEDATLPPQSQPAPNTGSQGDGAQEPEQQQQQQPEPSEQGGVPVIQIVNGKPDGGVLELEVKKGDDIRFIVESDIDEEVHLHGYDISADVPAGGRVEFKVPATIEGVFEVELEHSVVPIAEISVVPG